MVRNYIMGSWNGIAADWGVILRLDIDAHRIVGPFIETTGDAIICHFGLMGHSWWQANSGWLVVNNGLVIDLNIRPRLSHIVREEARVAGILEGVLCCILSMYLVIRGVLILSLYFLERLGHNILDSIGLLGIVQRCWGLNIIAQILCLSNHAQNTVIRLLDPGICLHLDDIGVIRNLVHFRDDAVHQWVETLHDVHSLLKILNLAKSSLDVFHIWAHFLQFRFGCGSDNDWCMGDNDRWRSMHDRHGHAPIVGLGCPSRTGRLVGCFTGSGCLGGRLSACHFSLLFGETKIATIHGTHLHQTRHCLGDLNQIPFHRSENCGGLSLWKLRFLELCERVGESLISTGQLCLLCLDQCLT